MSVPDHDSSLYVDDDTTATEVLNYTVERLCEPATVGDVVVFNFHSAELDARALVNANLDPGVYVVPYQVTGVWGFIVDVLPDPVGTAPLLNYAPTEEEYRVYENLRSAEVEVDPGGIRNAMWQMLNPQTRDIVFGGEVDA